MNTVVAGAGYGASVGAAGGPAGALLGGAVGAVVGGVIAAGIWFGGKWVANQMNKADEAAESGLDSTADGGACEDCMSAEEQQAREDELNEEAGVEQRTKGKTKHGERAGGMDQANEDFDSLQPGDVRDIDTKYGPGRTGTLQNGQRITVRPGSSEGPPTLEIRKPNGRGTEIRYPDLSG